MSNLAFKVNGDNGQFIFDDFITLTKTRFNSSAVAVFTVENNSLQTIYTCGNMNLKLLDNLQIDIESIDHQLKKVLTTTDLYLLKFFIEGETYLVFSFCFDKNFPVSERSHLWRMTEEFVFQIKDKLINLDHFQIKPKKEISPKFQGSIKLIEKARGLAFEQMSSGICHEINNPLTVMMGHANRLRRKFEKGNLTQEEGKDLADAIYRSGERIVKVINSLKAFSNLGEYEDFLEIPIEKIFNEFLHQYKEKMNVEGVAFELKMHSKSELIKIKQVAFLSALSEIADNCLEATKSAVDKQIIFEVESSPQAWIFYFINSGSPIESSEKEKIFFPFYTRKKVGQGMGLGLNIIRGVFENHGGSFELHETSKVTVFKGIIPK